MTCAGCGKKIEPESSVYPHLGKAYCSEWCAKWRTDEQQNRYVIRPLKPMDEEDEASYWLYGTLPKRRKPIAMRNKITGELRPVNLMDQEIHDPRWAWGPVYETEGDETK